MADISQIQGWIQESTEIRASYDSRWAKNLRLMKGIFSEKERTDSVVRKRSKIFFRKIWASVWRITASLYELYLKDPDTFRIEGRDGFEDPVKARLLQFMVEYRRDRLMRTQSLFKKFIWGFQNILGLGWTVGKLSWEYNPETGVDGPRFILYPNEQVYPDLSAETKEDMQYIIFENFMTKSQMEEMGYKNIDEAVATTIPINELRGVRYAGKTDAAQKSGDNVYPSPGTEGAGGKDGSNIGQRYRVMECFYREKGRIMFCVNDGKRVTFVDEVESPYGDRYPVIMGECLTEPHKLIGEGFPEPQEGPQESLNSNLNMRKDNIALLLNRPTYVSKFGGVDYQALSNRKTGGIVLMDDINAIKEADMQDVTRSSYMEAGADEAMMMDMSGVNDALNGMMKNEKATVAQINYSAGNAKMDLYAAIVGESFLKDFYTQLAYLIQRFETDEKVFAIANDKLRNEIGQYGGDIYNIDFEADCIINIGMGAAGREAEIRQTLLAWDRAIMSNQAAMAMLEIGISPPQGIRLVDTSQFLSDLLPKLGKKDIGKYFFAAKPPAQDPTQPGMAAGGGQATAAMRGSMTPQVGNNIMPEANSLQVGGFGGM